jgi:hypothetical protein
VKVHENKLIENAGVNAAKAFFEAQRCVFQSVALENDYGKDAYVDHTDDGEVSGLCVALQIKSGEKYVRRDGFAIPVEGHEQVWRDASLPVAGVVHDPDTGSLFWVNITAHLVAHAGERVTTIPVPKGNVLTPSTLREDFWPAMRFTPRPTINPILAVLSHDPASQEAALVECFGLGRNDARALVCVRYLLRALSGGPLRLAVRILAHATSHPDIFWTQTNWLPDAVRQRVRETFRWSDDEILALLASAEYDEWRRGLPGQNGYHLLVEDADLPSKLERLVSRAFDMSDDTGSTAVALALDLAAEQGLLTFERLAQREPRVLQMGGADEVVRVLREFGSVGMF